MRRLQDEADAYIETMKPYFPELHEESNDGASPSVTGKDLETIRAEHSVKTDAGLTQTIGLIGNMYRSLCSLQEDTLPKSRQWFAIMSEGPLDYMRDLENEASDYIETMKPRFPEPGEEAEALRSQERERAAV